MTMIEGPAGVIDRSVEVVLDAATLLTGIQAVLESRAEPRINVYRDGSVEFVTSQGLWVCKRKFFGAGLRDFSYIVSEDNQPADFTKVTYRDKVVWQMYCNGTLDVPLSTLGIERFADFLFASFFKESFEGGWHRGPSKFPWVIGGDLSKELQLIREQTGGLCRFLGNEYLYDGRNNKVYSGTFMGGVIK